MGLFLMVQKNVDSVIMVDIKQIINSNYLNSDPV